MEKILTRVFEDVVMALPQLQKVSSKTYILDEEIKLLQPQANSFLNALVQNRKRAIIAEIRKIVVGAAPQETFTITDALSTKEAAMTIATYVRCLFLTNPEAREKLLRFFKGLSEAEKLRFINRLWDSSKFDNSTHLIRGVLSQCGILPNAAVIPLDQKYGSGKGGDSKKKLIKHESNVKLRENGK